MAELLPPCARLPERAKNVRPSIRRTSGQSLPEENGSGADGSALTGEGGQPLVHRRVKTITRCRCAHMQLRVCLPWACRSAVVRCVSSRQPVASTATATPAKKNNFVPRGAKSIAPVFFLSPPTAKSTLRTFPQEGSRVENSRDVLQRPRPRAGERFMRHPPRSHSRTTRPPHGRSPSRCPPQPPPLSDGSPTCRIASPGRRWAPPHDRHAAADCTPAAVAPVRARRQPPPSPEPYQRLC